MAVKLHRYRLTWLEIGPIPAGRCRRRMVARIHAGALADAPAVSLDA